jgi:hypothetical protein
VAAESHVGSCDRRLSLETSRSASRTSLPIACSRSPTTITTSCNSYWGINRLAPLRGEARRARIQLRRDRGPAKGCGPRLRRLDGEVDPERAAETLPSLRALTDAGLITAGPRGLLHCARRLARASIPIQADGRNRLRLVGHLARRSALSAARPWMPSCCPERALSPNPSAVSDGGHATVLPAVRGMARLRAAMALQKLT